MRVQAVYNFYFEYQLPIIEPGTGFGLTIDVPNKGYAATVHSRRPEDELFYEDIGISLSQQAPVLTPFRGQGTLVYRVKERILDRLLVALDLTADAEELSTPEANTHWRDEAVFVANGVLDHLRVTARSPRIKGIERLWHPVEQIFTISHPYTESWFDLDNGTQLPVFPGEMNSSLRVGFVSPNGGTITQSALADSLASGQRPSLQAALLVDAEERLRSIDYRTAIPLAAMACEVAADRYAERQTKLGSNQVKAILKLPGLTFAQRRLERLTTAVCGRSLLQDDPQAFHAVDAIYAERNKIMHKGEVSESFALTPRPEQAVRVYQWISAVDRAVAWLEQLPTT